MTQNITYGLRREANVVPPGWRPDQERSVPAGAPAVVASAPVPAPVAPSSIGADPLQREEPAFRDSSTFHPAPAPVAEPAAAEPPAPEPSIPEPLVASVVEPVTAPATSAALHEAEAWEHEDQASGSVPELTFEASRFPLPFDEPAWRVDRGAEPETKAEPALESGATAASAEPQPEPQATIAASAVDAGEGDDEVGFMRAARRKAFWNRPAVRIALWLLACLMVVVLLAQYALAERDRVAAMYPQARPLLERMCRPLNCVVSAPRQIASIAIDSSTFTKVKDDTDAFRLQVALKNSSDLSLEMPALELTLTDANDQPVLRRVIQRDDSGAPAELAARGDWNGVISLRVPEVADRVTGYRLLAFYP